MKVGKKTPLTLAHFGFGPAGETLDEAELPVAGRRLVGAGRERRESLFRPLRAC